MKRVVAATVTALGLLSASTAGAQTPAQDSVTGQGDSGTGPRGSFLFQIDAHSGPSGEAPTGTASFYMALYGTFSGPVACLAVDGSAATLNFVVANPYDPSDLHVFTYTVIDSPTGDRITWATDQRAPTNCTPLSFPAPITTGDIVVEDAQPLPTSRQQCKNGGWRTFGVFNNQGDCVSFVATGGKNPPGNTTG